MSESDTTKKQEPVEKKPVKKEPAKKEVVKEEVPVETVTEDDVVETASSVEEGTSKEEDGKADAAEKEREEPADEESEGKEKDTLDKYNGVIVIPITAYSEMAENARNLVDHPILSDEAAEELSVNKTMIALTHAYRFFADKDEKKESDIGDPLTISPNTTTEQVPKVIRGGMASRILSAAKGGTYRLKLPLSGFYLLLRKPKLEFLNDLFEALDITMEELGKIIGDYRHTFRQAVFYRAVMDNLPKIVTYANIEGWKEEGVLEKSIAYGDMLNIMWGICILSGLRDYTYVSICPKCGERNEIEDLDVLSMVRLSKRFNPEAIEALSSSEVKTQDDLKKYRKMIHLTETVEEDGCTYELEEPMVYDWLDAALTHLELIREAVDGAPSMYKREVFNKSAMTMHHGIAPWIKKFTFKSVDGKTLNFEGRVAVEQQLDDCLTEDSWDALYDKLITAIIGFEHYTIGHAPKACRVKDCGYIDPDVEFITWDPNMTFLVTTYQKLVIAGLRVTAQTSDIG